MVKKLMRLRARSILGGSQAVRDTRVYHDLWYTVPSRKGGTTYGQCTVHRRAGPPNGVPGCDQRDARRVSAAGSALRGGFSSASGGVAPRWETSDRPPVYGVPELPLSYAGRSAVLHSHLSENLCPPGGARALVRHGP